MHTLNPLPFAYDALAPYISKQTLEFHHDKHHATYVNKLNELLAQYPDLLELSIEDLLVSLDKVPENIRTAVFNNAGQVYNHNVYWDSIAPKKDYTENRGAAEPIFDAIAHAFESMENFQTLWTDAGVGQFGSGWVWLSVNDAGNLEIEKTSNADTPLVRGKKPIMVMDVWEHAYYLDYQNKRPEYITNFFEVVDWESVQEKYLHSKA
jgi:superoxide dismutase, Fe-Mn family